jgi:phosphoribosyl-ATP pyrophosphohydrolase
VTIAGGVSTAQEIATLDRMGADAQVGMALYTGRLHLADAIAAPLASDRADGLFPTIVVDEHGLALGLAWSSRESLRAAVDERSGIYHSRTRGLWRKGATSGARQELLRVDLDCDRDALRFVVRQTDPGFCHAGTRTCFGEDHGLARLERRLASRILEPQLGSYTARLAADPKLLEQKLVEEARELAAARSPDEAVRELADLLYFALVQGLLQGASLEAVWRELALRERRITRRGGEPKPVHDGTDATEVVR